MDEGSRVLLRLLNGPDETVSTRKAARLLQRYRIMAAFTDLCAEQGTPQVTVGDVVARARVSRSAFYENFKDRTDCFLQTFDALVLAMFTLILESAPPPGAPAAQRIGGWLSGYLNGLADFPSAARLSLVEVYAAGPEAIARRLAVFDGFVAHARALIGDDLVGTDDDLRAVAGVVSATALNLVAAGRTEELRAQVEPLTAFCCRLVLAPPAA